MRVPPPSFPSASVRPVHRRRYHHGNLRQALIDTALDLAQERGHEEFSLRELARRVGVSSGAPFRHFAHREVLMGAIAEDAIHNLRTHVEHALRNSPNHPVDGLKTLGRCFIEWALNNPAQFRIISARRLYDFDRSVRLNLHFQALRDTTVSLIAQAQRLHAAPPNTLPAQDLALVLRASAYGLARMALEGQLPAWRPSVSNTPVAAKPGDHAAILVPLLDGLIDQLLASPPHAL